LATIMVVDDDNMIRCLLRQILTLQQHIVVEAADGMETLDIIRAASPPDLIFMDHQMPRLSGVDCARQLRTLYPCLKIVLMSGSFGLDDDGYLAANKYLFTDVILKPFRIQDIVSTVEYALRHKIGGGAGNRTPDTADMSRML
jgi:CheY-like chemotaxis protein